METFKWLKDFLKDKQIHTGLKDLVPDIFDKYLIIPWTVGIIDDFPFADYPDNKDTIENLNKQHAIEREFGIFLNKETETRYREITLKELAKRFDVAYCADTDYLIKQTPGISPLLKATKHKLTELLTRLKIGKELKLYIEDNFRFQAAHDDWRFHEENIIKDISNYITFQVETGWDSTSYLFSEDLKWCFCTVEDFDHFIFCSDNSTYATVQEIKNLETFEISYDFVLNRVCA
jgi:hypothetical protein